MPNKPLAGPRPCAWCGRTFRPAEAEAEGRRKYCSQECHDEAHRAYMVRYMRRWREENREHWTAYLRKRYAALPRDKLRAIAARYREKHHEEVRESHNRWREEHRDHVRIYARTYYRKRKGQPTP
jgi:hypothetical protein